MKPSGLDPTVEATASTTSDTAPTCASRAAIADYQLGEVLGRGGMGEVVLAEDLQVGRSVALKRLRTDEPSEDTIARFLREARIQARLEHPTIVPVHELGRDAEGRPYFTMRRLTGVTLASVLATAPRSRLLRVFVDVCQAIELAHARGVVHRDLKPSNIMLGDYGEVYVLDWGIALAADEPDESPGQLLGTPGYMAPEQVRCESVGAPADIYALGCILFEILTRETLHPRGEALATTLARPTRAPSTRAETPPELDTICLEALAADPGARPSARVLADRVQQYLDGDRDLEQRRLIAGEELTTALAALAADDRAEAMRAAGRALALDPRSTGAAQLVSSLMLEPPRQLPTELAEHLASVDRGFERRQWDKVALAWGSVFLFVPAVLWLGVTDPAPVVSVAIVVAILVALAWRWSRTGEPRLIVFMALGATTTMLMSRLFGNLIIVPGVFAVQLLGYTAHPWLLRRPTLPIVIVVAAFLVLQGLEMSDVIAQSWRIDGDTVVSQSHALTLAGSSTAVVLVLAHVVMFVVTGAFGWWLSRARHDAQRQVEIQAWHLRKLLPS